MFDICSKTDYLKLADIDWDNVDLNDPEVWTLFHQGKTKGIFQLESNLGRSWSKKLKPDNIEELSALVAILRPGALRGFITEDGKTKSITQKYIDRKHGLEKVTFIHDSCQDILKPTLGLMLYQEQTMQMARRIAGFSGVEADKLRKAIGKKDAELMAKIRKWFIEGCVNTAIIDGDKANEIYDIIEKSARYQFNKSHSVSYALNAYWTAYAKRYATNDFFVSYLEYSTEKPKPHVEVAELVSESKLFDFKVKTPKITDYKDTFFSPDFSDTIYFGVKNVKSLTGVNGDKTLSTLIKVQGDLQKEYKDISWMDLLIHLSPNINSSNFKTLASIGFFRGMKDKITRNKALYDYESFKNLTDSELKWVVSNYNTKKWDTLIDCFKSASVLKKEGGSTSRESRKQALLDEIKLLEYPVYSMEDDPDWIIDQEIKFIGCPISLSKISSADSLGANTTCREIIDGKEGKNLRVAANITRINDFIIKKEGTNKGKCMSFLTIEDETCSFEGTVIFPDRREENKYSLFVGNNVLIYGDCDKGSLIINKMMEI